MQYYFAYLISADQNIAVSVWCGTRNTINKMAVSDETSLISSEVECMGLAIGQCDFSNNTLREQGHVVKYFSKKATYHVIPNECVTVL